MFRLECDDIFINFFLIANATSFTSTLKLVRVINRSHFLPCSIFSDLVQKSPVCLYKMCVTERHLVCNSQGLTPNVISGYSLITSHVTGHPPADFARPMTELIVSDTPRITFINYWTHKMSFTRTRTHTYTVVRSSARRHPYTNIP